MLKIKIGLLFGIMILVSACTDHIETKEESSSPEEQAMSLDRQFALFNEWFPGEYDNYEQVWLQKEEGKKKPHEHIHHIFAPVSAPNIGKNTYFIKQYKDGDANKVYRQRLYNFSKSREENAVLLDIYTFLDEKKYANAHLTPEILKTLNRDELKNIKGCEVFWRYNGEYFDGYMKEKACHFKSRRSGKEIYITDDLRLTDNEIWIRDVAHDKDGNYVFGNKDGIHHKNRKVKYFDGWAGLKVKGMTAIKEDKEWYFMSKFRIHSEGQIVPLVDSKTGKKLDYSIELAQLTYQNTKTPILKLGLIDNKTGETIRYAWTNTDAEKIGLNLGWVQVGLTRKSNNIHVGYEVTK